MSLTTTDMQTFVTLLQQDVTLRQQIKQILFPEFDVEQTLARLTRLLERMDSRMAAQEQALAKVQSDVELLKTDVSVLKTDVSVLKTDVGELKGKSLEAFYHRRAPAIFGRYLTHGREASNQVADRLQVAFDQQLINDEEYDQILAADLFFGGKLRATGQALFLVMEASWYAQLQDVQRAAERAAIGQRAGLSTIPVVGGEDWSNEAVKLATERAVVRTVNGRLDRLSWQSALVVWLA